MSISYDPVSLVVAGIIDWGEAAKGDPAIDFSELITGLGIDFARLVARSYTRQIDRTFWKRAEFYS